MSGLRCLLQATREGVVRSSGRNSSSKGWIYESRDFDSFRKKMVLTTKVSEPCSRSWRLIFYFASIPCLALTMYHAYRDHINREAKDPPKYIPYDYLNVRKRPFPWGDGNHSLFHNPRTQYVPGVGFEEERKKH